MSNETEAAEAGKAVYPSSLVSARIQEGADDAGNHWMVFKPLPGMLVRFWSHQQCFVLPWEPAEEELVHAETLASTG